MRQVPSQQCALAIDYPVTDFKIHNSLWHISAGRLSVAAAGKDVWDRESISPWQAWTRTLQQLHAACHERTPHASGGSKPRIRLALLRPRWSNYWKAREVLCTFVISRATTHSLAPSSTLAASARIAARLCGGAYSRRVTCTAATIESL